MARTIFAPATAAGRAAVAIVRISGPAAAAAAARLTGSTIPLDRIARLRRLTDPATGAALDEALVLGFPAGGSFTGEPVVELHLHGSPAVLRAVLDVLSRDAALTPAEPGAFARQAFENGRLSLPQVEALADLIDAETEAQRRQALGGLGGALAEAAEGWRRMLIEAMALIEATIDFADEDIDHDTPRDAALAVIADVRAALARELAGAAAAQRIRDGLTVAVIGPPNVGKSSLINALARADVALVSDVPGTTRDVISVRLELGGLLVTVLDTAGLRETDDPVERMGVARARQRAAAADLRLFVSDPLHAADRAEFQAGDLRVSNKCDLARGDGLPVSALTGEGLAQLVAAIRVALARRVAEPGLATQARQRAAIAAALDALDLTPDMPVELVAEGLRRAAQRLDALIGRVDVEDVLGAVFARFCIGK